MAFSNLNFSRRHIPTYLLAFFVSLTLLSLTNYLLPFTNLRKKPLEGGNDQPPTYNFTYARPKKKKYTSQIVEEFLESLEPVIKDRDLYTLLQNCLPNTLDTTIEWFNKDKGDPRTFLITGDIPAMWIRDSTNQIKPYLRFVNDDIELKDLIFGVIQVQATYLNYDPYANAFLKPWYAPQKDHEDKRKGSTTDRVVPSYDPSVVWESKYELDSIGHFFQLTNEYLKATGEYDRVFKSKVWTTAIPRIFKVLQTQMQDTWPSKQLKLPNIKVMNSKDPQPVLLEDGYRFRRQTDRPTETLGEYGIGGITKRCGLIRSAFRPSDDATTLPYLIPANALVSSQLKQLSEYVNLYLSKHPENDNTEFFDDLKNKAGKLSKTIKRAIFKHAVIDHPEFGRVFAYEVDCYGSHLIMDDANTPSLLSMPLFGFVATTDKIYQNTRKMILSEWNPWFFQSEFGKGIGSPHTGQNMIWPLSLLMQLQTTTSEAEVKEALLTVKKIANVTGGLMCESIDVNKPDKYTRPWFSWANSVAGETILQLKEKYSDL